MVVNDERWKKAPDGGGEVCRVYISPGFETRGNTTTAATGNLLPIAAVTVYIKVCPPTLFLFFYTQLTLIHRMSYIQFQFLVIVLTCHKSMHHAK